jgi:hypothetical protein
MKGFWSRRAKRWDAAAYTRLYNAVYDAVKAVHPDAQLGGPHIVLDSWRAGAHKTPAIEASGARGAFAQRALDVVRYWLAHAHGADFIALDGANGRNKDDSAAGPFTGCDAFAAAARWLRALGRSGYPLARTLPLVWSEWAAAPNAAYAGLNQNNAIIASCMITTLRSGAAAVPDLVPGGRPQRQRVPGGALDEHRGRGRRASHAVGGDPARLPHGVRAPAPRCSPPASSSAPSVLTLRGLQPDNGPWSRSRPRARRVRPRSLRLRKRLRKISCGVSGNLTASRRRGYGSRRSAPAAAAYARRNRRAPQA